MAVAVHTHETAGEGDKIVRTVLETATVSLAGSIVAPSRVNLTLTAWCFFPMIHMTATSPSGERLGSHSSDGASADAPRLSLDAQASGTTTYDVDYRYLSS